jgi:hypothetical protein
MKNIALLFSFLLIIQYNYSQCNGRYQDEIFSSVSINTVNYSDVYTDFRHEMDIYTPDGDAETNRPVVFYMHGGSFTGGDKSLTDCVDFCTSMAKRGYIAISSNYRLSPIPLTFVLNQEEQYRTVLKSVADIKAAVRYIRKDHTNGNSLGSDPNGIYIGGYSAGAVLSLHLAYIDQISDLPTSPIDVQNLVASIGGTLEGDAGNDGYSSEIHGVISFAGGINDVNWIDSNDEPVVFVQGDADGTVSYNCAPGLGLSSVLTLCGTGEMQPQADLVGVINDALTYSGEGHGWGSSGSGNPLFDTAVQFAVDFLYPLLPCNQVISNNEITQFKPKVYPNPASDQINITSNLTIVDISIYNTIGKLLMDQPINKKDFTININKLLAGIYLIELTDENGNKSCKRILIN